ncbi:hypothetical protein SEVIR_9G571400v4 [Setaria viridis]|uniref:Uncharacterized protein n=1 Tax=Setaria viridis TaxID=4556 RepID=A0A4U6T9K1_SETVI|nr:hypothetical protein SEVIR_9G571400v2 [Setaria viridis]
MGLLAPPRLPRTPFFSAAAAPVVPPPPSQSPSSLPSAPSFPLDALLPSCRSTPAPSAAAAGIVLLLGAATAGLPRATAAQYSSPARGTASRSRRRRRASALASAAPSLPSPNSARVVQGLLHPAGSTVLLLHPGPGGWEAMMA